MKSVIYLDELLLTNFVLAALFLTAAGLLCATVCTGVRLCTGAALAAVSALVLLAPELPGAVAVGYKIFTGCAVVAAAYGLPGGGVLPGCVRGMHCSTCCCAERWCCPACRAAT